MIYHQEEEEGSKIYYIISDGKKEVHFYEKEEVGVAEIFRAHKKEFADKAVKLYGSDCPANHPLGRSGLMYCAVYSFDGSDFVYGFPYQYENNPHYQEKWKSQNN